MKYSILFLLVIAPSILLGAGTAFPNGINPPRPKTVSTVRAICAERSSDRRYEIYRARITDGKASSEVLTFRIGPTNQQLDLTQIKAVLLPSKGGDSAGFATVGLVRRDSDKQESALLQVRSKDSKLSLAGFSQTGERIEVELAQCKTIDFAAASSMENGPPAKPATKK